MPDATELAEAAESAPAPGGGGAAAAESAPAPGGGGAAAAESAPAPGGGGAAAAERTGTGRRRRRRSRVGSGRFLGVRVGIIVRHQLPSVRLGQLDGFPAGLGRIDDPSLLDFEAGDVGVVGQVHLLPVLVEHALQHRDGRRAALGRHVVEAAEAHAGDGEAEVEGADHAQLHLERQLLHLAHGVGQLGLLLVHAVVGAGGQQPGGLERLALHVVVELALLLPLVRVLLEGPPGPLHPVDQVRADVVAAFEPQDGSLGLVDVRSEPDAGGAGGEALGLGDVEGQAGLLPLEEQLGTAEGGRADLQGLEAALRNLLRHIRPQRFDALLHGEVGQHLERDLQTASFRLAGGLVGQALAELGGVLAQNRRDLFGDRQGLRRLRLPRGLWLQVAEGGAAAEADRHREAAVAEHSTAKGVNVEARFDVPFELLPHLRGTPIFILQVDQARGQQATHAGQVAVPPMVPLLALGALVQSLDVHGQVAQHLLLPRVPIPAGGKMPVGLGLLLNNDALELLPRHAHRCSL